MSEKRKKKKREPASSIGRRLTSIAFILFVVAVFAVVVIAMRTGIGTLSSGTGIVEPDEEKIRSFQQSRSTEAADAAQPSEPEEADSDLAAAQAVLDGMTLEEKVCQLFITTPDKLSGTIGTADADGALNDALSERPLGGLILYETNIYTPEQVTQMLSGVQENAKIPLLLGINAEPGNDEGLSKFGVTKELESAASFAEGNKTSKLRSAAEMLGNDMRAVGFSLNFAPNADVLVDENNTEVADCSFGSDPQIVSDMVCRMIAGLHEANIITCAKHFPGLAGTVNSTEYFNVSSERTMDELNETELVPFRAAIESGVDMVMVSHIRLSSVIDGELPCSLSPIAVQEILRTELGFQGVIITDSLRKAAITSRYSSDEAAVAAIQAGCDMLLIPNDLENAINGILTAIEDGQLREERIDESVLRILTLKSKYGLLP